MRERDVESVRTPRESDGRLNGVAYARVRGSETATTNTIQLVHADGSALSVAEQQAVTDLFDLPGWIETAINNLFNPCEHLMGA